MSSRTASKLTDDFLEEEITLRGVTYTFRELTGAKYEEFLKICEGEDGTADLSAVLKLMIPESLVTPRLTTEQIVAKPLPVYNALAGVVNRMHFRTEQPDTPSKNGASGEEPVSGNDSEPQTS